MPLGGTSANLRAGIDVGLVLPFAGRALAVVVSADYTAPKSEGTVTGDTRVNSASYDWHLTEHVFAVMPTLQYRLLSLGKLVPYAGVGPRVYFLTSNVTGSVGGTAIPETSERSTTVGIGVPVGLEYTLGPGRLQAELLFDYGGLSHAATGSSNAGALSLFAGYRIHM